MSNLSNVKYNFYVSSKSPFVFFKKQREDSNRKGKTNACISYEKKKKKSSLHAAMLLYRIPKRS